MNQNKCTSCNAKIIWADTVKGRRIPLDAQPVDDGNMTLDYSRGHDYPPLARVVSAQAPPRTMILYKSHFATCPNAAAHRRGGKQH